MLCAAAASSAYGRSLLYYYDFEDVQNGGLVYSEINRGSGSVELTGKFKSGSTIPYSTSGAFGSSGAYKAASNQNSLWLGDGSASLGCGTEKGFTLSFWMKTQTSHIAWTNPFGFRLAGIDYRIEYTTANDGNFTIYYRDSNGDHTAVAQTIQVPDAGVWKHYAFVFRPNCGKTAGLGTCTIYIDGQARRDGARRKVKELETGNTFTFTQSFHEPRDADRATRPANGARPRGRGQDACRRRRAEIC